AGQAGAALEMLDRTFRLLGCLPGPRLARTRLNQMNDEVLIIGGGLAGLAAGVALAGAGRRVRVLEQKPYLGGRARSFVDPVTGCVVDNGQHMFMGCYRATLRFLAEIGTLDRVRFQPRL